MIRKAKKTDKNAVIDLWRTGFGETDSFLDFYFGTYYQEDYTYLYLEDGKVAASLQEVPFDLYNQGHLLPATYILGVVTHPLHRKKGFAGRLLCTSLTEQYKKGILFTTLIPQEEYLFDVYRKYGFSEAFYADEVVVRRTGEEQAQWPDGCKVLKWGKDTGIPPEYFNAFFDFYTKAYKDSGVCMLKSKTDLAFYADAFLGFEGDIYVYLNVKDVGVKACAFVTQNRPARIKELLYDDETGKNAILSALFKETEQDSASVLTPARGGFGVSCQARPLGMARVVNAEKWADCFARIYCADIDITLSDKQIRENNQHFHIHQNQSEEIAFTGTAEAFAPFSLMYGLHQEKDYGHAQAKCPYMNLMLN